MKIRKVIALLTVCIFIATGCASIVSKSQYPVTFSSQPDQAGISIVDETGKVIYKGKTPTTVTLEAGAGFFRGKNYTVIFSKEDYPNHTAEIKRSVDGWYILGNLIFGGLIGLLIVDPATGAMWTLENHVSIDLSTGESFIKKPTKGPSSEDDYTRNNSTGASISLVLLEDVPQHLRDKMVKIR